MVIELDLTKSELSIEGHAQMPCDKPQGTASTDHSKSEFSIEHDNAHDLAFTASNHKILRLPGGTTQCLAALWSLSKYMKCRGP